jgi:uncharacterized protein YxjI
MKVLIAICLLALAGTAQAGEIRKDPFSMTETYRTYDDNGRETGRIEKQPFSMQPQYRVYDQNGNSQGTITKDPFGMTETWDVEED